MPIIIGIVFGVAVLYGAYRFGKRDRWLEPHCYCRGDERGHACLTECWHGKRQQHGWSERFKRFDAMPRWKKWFHTYS